MNIIDNFLSDDYFKAIQTIVLSNEFSWFYYDGVVDPEDGKYQFVKGIYDESFRNPIIDRKSFLLLEPILYKLNVSDLYRVKANLNIKTEEHEHSVFHTDYTDMTTSIFYINTNNGWTQFNNGDKVECVANRMVIFDSNLEHEGVTCTDQNRKVVFNFNYVPS